MSHAVRGLLLVVSALLLTTAACREGDDSPFLGIAKPNAPYDQRFIDEMIVHHQGAITSARMMIANSQRPELRDLAQRIIDGQQRQIAQMRSWRAQWYGGADAPTTGMEAMGAMMQGMMGGMMGGADQDRMFLRMMIPHHQLAIDMAEDALKRAEHLEIKNLARQIVADQSAEITEMEGYLRDWYGESSTRDTAAGMRDMMRRMMGR